MMGGSTTEGPTTDEPEHAWQRGREAGLSESAMDANPYQAGSELAADWSDGWHEGTKLSNYPADGRQAWAAWMTGADQSEPDQTGAS